MKTRRETFFDGINKINGIGIQPERRRLDLFVRLSPIILILLILSKFPCLPS